MLHFRDDELLAARFGRTLVELRESRGLSLRAAAKRIGIDHGRLFSFERGVERTTGRPTLPSAAQTVQIALAYRYPKERLLAEAGYIPWSLEVGQVDGLLAFFAAEHGQDHTARRFISAEHPGKNAYGTANANEPEGMEP